MVAQPYGDADRGEPGDAMMHAYLRAEAEHMERDFPGNLRSLTEWMAQRPRWIEEYHEMLGLKPMPQRTPLQATVTGTLDGEGYAVELLHYQSRPGLYVTANLYRPSQIQEGTRLPAILYLCGHSPRGRDGNKTAFQSHGIWFARHGYVCLILDTLQMGELPGVHHGTYREERWWWLSRGYTPAGVEAWNGIRGLDYLESRPDVDAARMGVTGISGGGAATLWVAAADERARVVVPVSGLADLESYVPNRVINGHCDCMFFYNCHLWPWTRIAALVAPRPFLFVNSDRDPIFPMDANDRVINRLERVYSWYGAGDRVDSFVSIGGHDYRRDIREGVYRFLNIHLQLDPRPITDSEQDLVTGSREEDHPIPPHRLRVFPLDSDLPTDALNAVIDQEFVPQADPGMPTSGAFDRWKSERIDQLRRRTFRHFPERVPAAVLAKASSSLVFEGDTEPGITIRLRRVNPSVARADRVLVYVTGSDVSETPPAWFEAERQPEDLVYVCEPRGVGGRRWTSRNPPNYVERSHFLLGRTADSGRVWDIAAAARSLRERHGGQLPVHVAGEGASAVWAAYAALLEPEIDAFILHEPPLTHMDPSAPVLLNVLRVCDIAHTLGMLAPRELRLQRVPEVWAKTVSELYRAAGAADRLILGP
jgi:dienelactone hydrolase